MAVDHVDQQSGLVHALLEGGPSDLPPAVRICRVGADEAKVKVPRGGGYEHFERTEERTVRDGVSVVLFR